MLTNYANNLFATRSTLTEALTQANDLYGNAMSQADSIAMRTAVYVVLNTAIQQHTIELNAVYDKHAAEVFDLRSKLAARLDPVSALMAMVDERVTVALATQNVEGRIDNFLTHNLSDRLGETFAEKFDDAIDSWADDKLGDKVEQVIDLDDLVQEKVAEYFSSNSFTIEAR